MNLASLFFPSRVESLHAVPDLTGSVTVPNRALGESGQPDVPHPDIELVAACLRGKEGGWVQLVNKYSGLVYSIAYRYSSSRDEADDVFQNVFIIVLKSLPRLRQKESLAAWLSIITRREAQRLSQSRKRWVELDEELVDKSEQPVDQIHRQFLRQQVHTALRQLDTFSRDFLLACFEDPPPTYQDLAARFAMPLGSIGPTRGRCLKKLKSILAGMGIKQLDGIELDRPA